jgi:ribosomal subunit interface protein
LGAAKADAARAMLVRVSGKQVELGEALPAFVKERLESAIAKHFDGGAEAHVVFSHEGSFYRVDCTLHLDSSAVLKAEGEDSEARRAFDTAFDRIESQLRRYKRKLKNHHGNGNRTLEG